MIMRATQKKMMSKPVTSTEEGRNVVAARGVLLPASRASERHTAPTRTRCRARRRRGAARGSRRLRARLRARFVLAARDVDVAGLVVPRRDLMAPPQLARDAPVLDVLEPLVVGRGPVLGDELDARPSRHRLERRRCAERRPSPRTTGRSASARRSSPVRPQRGTHQLVRLLRHEQARASRSASTALARLEAIEAAVLRRRVVVDLRVEREDADRRAARGAARPA